MAETSVNPADELTALRPNRRPATAPHLTCQGCSTAFLQPAPGDSLRCPYCQAVTRVDPDSVIQRMAPDRILPAAIREDEARELLRRWAKEHRIDAPSEPLEAGYLPFWVIEVDGEIVSPAAPVRRPGADLAVTLTRALAALRPGMYRTVDRELFREIDHESDRQPVDRLPLSHHATVPAARRMPELLNEIRLAGATVPPAFDSSLLAGWPAEGCQVPVGEAMAEAHAQVISRAKGEFRSWFRGRARYDTSGLAMADFDLLLIPLWMTTVGAAGGGQRACAHAVTGEVFVGRALGRV